MEAKTKHLLLGAIAVVVLYQSIKILTKPKQTEIKSNASGKKMVAGTLKYDRGTGKVSKLVIDGFDSRWVRLADQNQPKALEYYKYNGKWIWTKWNGKLDM